MKKNNASAKCPNTKDCRSTLVGSVLTLIISVLLWLQSLGCKDCQKLDGRNTNELTEALEKLQQFADHAQNMTDEACKTCCQNYDDESRKVTFSELDPALSKQTQTIICDLKDTATQPDPAVVTEKEVQNSIDCRCEITQKSNTQIRDEKNQCNLGAYEKSCQVQPEKVQVEPLKEQSCECDVRKRDSLKAVNAEIAEVYRSLVSDEADVDEEEEEEEEGEEMLMDPEQYQCPQICTPYPPQQRSPSFARPVSPYDRREQVPKRSDMRQQSYPRYSPDMYNRQQFQYQPPPPGGPMYTVPAVYPHLRPCNYQKPNSYQKSPPISSNAQNSRPRSPQCVPCSPRPPPPLPPPPPPIQRCVPVQASQSSSRPRSPIKYTPPARECVKECPGLIKPPIYQEYISECLPECQSRSRTPTRQLSLEDCTYCTPKCTSGKSCQQPQKPVQKQPQEPVKKVSISTPGECKLHCPGSSQPRPPIALMPKGAIPVIPPNAAEFDVQKAIAPPPEKASYMSVEDPAK